MSHPWLLVLCTILLMIIIQAWRIAYFARRNLGNTKPLWQLTIEVLTLNNLSANSKWYNYLYHYLNIANGRNLSVYKDMLLTLNNITDVQQAELDNDLDILEYYSHSVVIKYILHHARDVDEFREICASLSEDLKRETPVTPTGLRMLSHAKQFSRVHDIALERILEVNDTYLTGTSDEWIQKRLSEKNNT